MPANRGSTTANNPLRNSASSSRTAIQERRRRAQVIVDGFGQLVEGQRRFAEEFGLPYERVFSDGFEAFKGRDVRGVIRDWLQGKGGGADELDRLLRDLAEHQLALLCAAEAVSRELPDRPRPNRFATLLRQRQSSSRPSPLPLMVAAYARSREVGASDTDDKEQSI